MKRMILVDGNSLMYRAYFATAATGNIRPNSKGQYTNAVLAFARMMNTLQKQSYDNILVAFDASKHTFRHDILTDYKAGRASMPDEMRTQIAHIKELLNILNINQYELLNYEADDIIGTFANMAKEKDYRVDIYSSDKDMLQLVDDNVTVYLTKKGLAELEEYNKQSFFDKYEIEVSQFIDLKAMMGDKSDNLAGIKGIGQKKAVKLLTEYKTLENIIENKEDIKGADGQKIRDGYNDALVCKKMVTICKDAPATITFDFTTRKESDLLRLKSFYEQLELNSLLKDLILNNKEERKQQNIEFTYINNPLDLKNILVEYSTILVEIMPRNYHKEEILSFGIKNHLGNFIIDLSLLSDKNLIWFLQDEDMTKFTFNYKLAYVVLKKYNINLSGVKYDMLLATYLIDPSISSKEFKLICQYFNYNDVSYEEEIYNKGAKLAKPENIVIDNYVISKLNAIHILRKSILQKLEEKNQISLLQDIEIPLSKILGQMEFDGVSVDMDELNKQNIKLESRILELEENIYLLATKKFNISSPKQLGVILFEELGLTPPKKTKTGYSTDNDVLQSLLDEHPIISYIITYRQLTKLQATYIEGLKNQVFDDLKVHTIYLQALTQTGRLSSIEPNLQNIPVKTLEGKDIRKIFVPSKEGNSFLSCDYSQIELRVLAHMAHVKSLIDSFNNKEDVHSKTAMEIFNKTEITELDRRRAKAVNFGIIYGMSAYGLAQDLKINNVLAANYIKRYYEVYSEIKDFMEDTIDFAIENEYVKTIKNRIRLVPEINSKNYMQREATKRIVMNAPIQGSAADILKIAMIDVYNEMNKRQLKSKMLLQVHDELIFEIEKGEEEIMKELVVSKMQNCIKLDVDLIVEYGIGKNWYEVK